MLKGKRTIIIAIFPLIWAVLASIGIDVPLEEQATIVAGATAALMIGMRTVTTGPVGES